MLRSAVNRKMANNPKRLIQEKADFRSSFCSDAAFHVINAASVVDLDKRVRLNNPEGLPNHFVSEE